ncbi:MAG: triose-phosphate isomerase [Pseudomonadota bacterium]
MRKTFIAGNWKMNLSKQQAITLANQLKQQYQPLENRQIAVFPAFVYLDAMQQILQDSSLEWGAQNCADKAAGAFTGEVSVSMLQDFACKYVLLGHSERRHVYQETNAMIAEKFTLAQQAGLQSVLCVGETLAQREANQALEVIQRQLDAVLDLPIIEATATPNWLIAYEPVWAIGTGKTASPAQAQEIHQQIREYIGKNNGNLAANLRIIYGGSVKAANAGEILAMEDIDGVLVGGASLKIEEFLEICKCNNSY